MTLGMAKVCSVKGCAGRHAARGYCAKHYQQNRRHGSPTRRIAIVRHCPHCGKDLPKLVRAQIIETDPGRETVSPGPNGTPASV